MIPFEVPLRRRLRPLGLLFCLAAAGAPALAAPAPVSAQLAAPQASASDLGLLLRQLDGERRVLMIAAHPDDEDTSLLATLALGQGVRTAYLSLSRGEGGQNLIGPELEEGLGITRTGELLAARSLDGAEQYFTRAFDFGYSRTADETVGHWPQDEVLRDVVEVVRTFRPHVIVSIFTGTTRDGHGQHQAAGIAARQAFQAAGDPDRFPDQLRGGREPWTPLKLYQSTRFRIEETTLEIPTGTFDPLLGRSHLQVAMESRSRHRSQDMGAAQTPGPRSTGLELVEARTAGSSGTAGAAGAAGAAGGGGAADAARGAPAEPGIFTGIDTTLAGLARALPGSDQGDLVAAIESYRAGVHRASAELRAGDPGAVLPDLLGAAAALERARDLTTRAPAGAPRTELAAVLDARHRTLSEALLAAGSVVVDVRTDRPTATPGDEVGVELLVWNGGGRDWTIREVGLDLPPGWTIEPPSGSAPATPAIVRAGTVERHRFRLRVPVDAPPSRLYYLEEPRDGSLYRWPEDPQLRGRPGNPPLIQGRVALEAAGGVHAGGTDAGGAVPGGTHPARILRAGVHVDVDKALGEFRVPFFVVPTLSVEVDPIQAAWPLSHTGPRTFTVRVTNHSGEAMRGTLALEGPAGWTVEPAERALEVAPGGGEVSYAFEVHPPGRAGAGSQTAAGGATAPDAADGGDASSADFVRFSAVARAGGREFREGLSMIDHPHLDPVPFYRASDVEITHLPVLVAEGLRVGYLMGPGDDGMRALRDLGVTVESLGPEAFREGDLDRFDAIVLGIRAYETRTDLILANERLLEFARRGGTVIVQYNKYEYPDGGFAPYPVSMRRPHDRVTDPDAPVTFLDPEHPLLSSPNRITPADFDGWIQERGLYFLNSFDDRYTPLLEMSDPGQSPNAGSLVVARVGEGAYVYTGLALFRQLPKGVPGSFRLLANLVSLKGSELPADGDEGR